MVRDLWDRRYYSPFAMHQSPGRADQRTTSAHCRRRLPWTAPAPKPAITAAASRTGQQDPNASTLYATAMRMLPNVTTARGP